MRWLGWISIVLGAVLIVVIVFCSTSLYRKLDSIPIAFGELFIMQASEIDALKERLARTEGRLDAMIRLQQVPESVIEELRAEIEQAQKEIEQKESVPR